MLLMSMLDCPNFALFLKKIALLYSLLKTLQCSHALVLQ